jgi:hypothetical protein
MSGRRRWWPELYLLVTFAAAVSISSTAYHFGYNAVWVGSVIWGIALLSSVFLVTIVRRSGMDWHREVRVLLCVGVAVGVFSIFTGLGNNFTDESHTISGFLSEFLQGKDPYTHYLSMTYTNSFLGFPSMTVTSTSTYTYMPLLIFLQVPGTGYIGYELFCLACWVGIVWVLRNEEFAAIALVSPVVALLAANGFTDLPVLFLVTYALKSNYKWVKRAAEYVSYGLKQFANVFWFAYYVIKKQWLRAVGVVAITFLICLPFIVWHPTGIYCEALTFSMGPGCSSAPNTSKNISDLYSHWNYYMWILWGLVLYNDWLRKVFVQVLAKLGLGAKRA